MGGRIGEGMPRMANERLPEQSIPDRSPGHAFIAMTNSVAGTIHFRTNRGYLLVENAKRKES